VNSQQPAAAPTIPFVPVRRKDRAVEDAAWITTLLQRAPLGVLATVYEDQPHVNANLFVYDAATHAIYLHTAARGRTRTNVEGEMRVCFTVNEMGRLLPAEEALEMSVEYAGVVVFGCATLVEEESEARRGLQLLLDKYFAHLQAGVDYRAIQPEELKRTTVYRIDIERWSGKKKEAPADFPGAFFYQQ
jgi:nitroimidazol reductase NimA-like FMN-containing flavoprotein (pyridoxamine 5'-phosphate oxidase superfamily)